MEQGQTAHVEDTERVKMMVEGGYLEYVEEETPPKGKHKAAVRPATSPGPDPAPSAEFTAPDPHTE